MQPSMYCIPRRERVRWLLSAACAVVLCSLLLSLYLPRETHGPGTMPFNGTNATLNGTDDMPLNATNTTLTGADAMPFNTIEATVRGTDALPVNDTHGTVSGNSTTGGEEGGPRTIVLTWDGAVNQSEEQLQDEWRDQGVFNSSGFGQAVEEVFVDRNLTDSGASAVAASFSVIVIVALIAKWGLMFCG